MARAASGVYGGVSADERRTERRRKLLEAGLEIMGTEGWSAMTVRGVCRQAQLTPRFFYESFDDIDALGVAVLDEIVTSVTGHGIEALASVPDDPAAKVRAAVETMVSEFTDDPRRGRVAFVEALGSEPLMRRRLAGMREVARLIDEQARAIYGLPRQLPREAARFVELASIVLTGGLTELMIVWLNGDLDMTREELVEASVELFARTGQSSYEIALRLARES